MKRSIFKYTQQTFVFALILLLGGAVEGYAQRRSLDETQRRQLRNERSSRDSRRSYKNDTRSDSRREYRYEKRERNDRHYRKNDRHRHDDRYHSHYHYRYTKPRHYHHKSYHTDVIIRHNRCVSHPRYGEVVVRFGRPPKILRHRHGHYYYSGGYCYEYMPAIGYVRVDSYHNSYFMELPTGYSRVWYNGRHYYMWDDLCFVKYRRGYRIITPPRGIHIHINI
ncbi:hypothetical protein EMN47_02360 [Prolixibacteraceae bacterium JC049]|nr:hypothetical protein [Prolixibacteraceae bacterium JC049]